ncbi:DUF4138 domain-containing protein [Flagellimonas nanhaiensis]|uniref:DUF4138 domain-containing protein n=1 Tax=Flagellimonas nanhaiensis TaxID=2292706 RepID=A0A371JLM9_9FLAO|nr:DUF4138 domain-containing protein [Allomuricauda nanhaiensis]RDY57922.1 DUF4138 domain-containing protein [Allomuricauda nanhaiensis]
MKKLISLLLVLFPMLTGNAQETLYANETHVVTLFFPSPIRQAVTGTEHFTFSYNRDSGQQFGLLQANTGSDSNLFVLTEDGRVYAYDLVYSKQLIQNYRFVQIGESIGHESQTKPVQPSEVVDSVPEVGNPLLVGHENELMVKGAEYLLGKKSRILRTCRKDGLALRLKELFYYSDKVYLELEIQNRSEIDFEMEALEIFRVNGQKGKRSSHQKLELKPIFKYQDPNIIRVGQKQAFVYVLPKFTLGDSEKLTVELHEIKGNRMLRLIWD